MIQCKYIVAQSPAYLGLKEAEKELNDRLVKAHQELPGIALAVWSLVHEGGQVYATLAYDDGRMAKPLEAEQKTRRGRPRKAEAIA